MIKNLIFELMHTTESAALASFPLLGRGKKNAIDQLAVDAMRKALNKINMDGRIVIGEGEIDEAPMLYIDEPVGTGKGYTVDIAVDPIDGTRMAAMGQDNAISVLAVGEKSSLLSAPDMYMEKLIGPPETRGILQLGLGLHKNIKNIAQSLNKPINQLTMMTLDKPRHQSMINQVRKLGIKVYAVPDGDIATSILVCSPNNGVDFMYGIGGAPEGVISAVAVRALGGNMQGRLLSRRNVKGESPENNAISKQEEQRLRNMNLEPDQLLQLEDIARTDNIAFIATGITRGDLLNGISYENGFIHTDSLIIHGNSKLSQRIVTTHHIKNHKQQFQEKVTIVKQEITEESIS